MQENQDLEQQINEIDMDIDPSLLDDDEDGFGNIDYSKITKNAALSPQRVEETDFENEEEDDRPVIQKTGIIINLSDSPKDDLPLDDVPTLISQPIKCTTEQDVMNAVNDTNTPYGQMKNSNYSCFGEDDYLECSCGEDDYFETPKVKEVGVVELEPELLPDEVNESRQAKKISQGQVEADYWERLTKQHAKTNKKGTGIPHVHYGGIPELAKDMFNHDVTPEGKIPTSGSAVKIADGADMSTGGEVSGAMDSGASGCCGEGLKSKSKNRELFENLLIITGFNLIPEEDGFILKDKCGMVNDMNCKDEKDALCQLKPYIDDSFIIPLQCATGEKFKEPQEWCTWYDKEKEKKFPSCKSDIEYCKMLGDYLK